LLLLLLYFEVVHFFKEILNLFTKTNKNKTKQKPHRKRNELCLDWV